MVFLCLELDHAIGLLAFGASIEHFAITRMYEEFHTTLGRLDATQGRTKLYDAIMAAGEVLIAYRDSHRSEMIERAPLRIFALTDGEDNDSTNEPWMVARWLQDHGIVLDSFPMAHKNAKLHAMARATGGICITVTSIEQGMQLFGDEALMHLTGRQACSQTPLLTSAEELVALMSTSEPDAAISLSASAPVLQGPCMLKIDAAAAYAKLEPNQQGCGGGAMKRIMKELQVLGADPPSNSSAGPAGDDVFEWQGTIQGPAGTPYEDGVFFPEHPFPHRLPFQASKGALHYEGVPPKHQQ